MGYEQTLKLKDNEQAGITNVETGDHRLVPKKVTYYKQDPNYEKFTPNSIFTKMYTEAWELLKTQTTDNEYKVAHALAFKAKAFTNSLQPLDDETTATELSEIFDIRRQDADKIFKKLFDLGVYGRFEVTEQNKEFKKYWVFNPYLSFNGKIIEKGVSGLFKNTTYAKIMRNR